MHTSMHTEEDRAHKHACMHAHTHMHAHACTHMHMHMRTRTHAQAHMCMLTQMYAHTYTPTCVHMNMHTYRYTQTHMRAHTRTHHVKFLVLFSLQNSLHLKGAAGTEGEEGEALTTSILNEISPSACSSYLPELSISLSLCSLVEATIFYI